MFKSNRRFRLWDSRVSHDQLLIRSPATPEIATNIDIVFWGVEFISFPTLFRGPEIERGSDERDAGLISVQPTNGELFVIVSDEKRFAIVAAGFKVLENTLDIFESSLEGFAATESGRDLGKVLAHS